ncbi:replicative DNA helicase [Tumebacillus permanentifrigoris]|uniref:Replicative DNA helicase n=1 Tax=Tumebacillus permanentifrigoris TaxID=378543 RepID=A0A316D563_9BACL|nr:replicative DNA helicase [Tumebacillus permanentifrigoris]PWK05275.1 replicative DNA helicase [Tumebacillus permanentifrigoris]
MLQSVTTNTNLEAEQAVLGAIIIDGDIIKDCTLKHGQFGPEEHRYIFKAMRELDERGEPVDIVTLSERLSIGGVLRRIGGVEYLKALTETVVTTGNFDHWQQIVVDYWKVRKSKEVLRQSSVELSSPDELVELQRRLAQIEEFGHTTEYDHKQTILNLYDQFETPREIGVHAITTGYSDLDKMVFGLEGGQVIIIAARPAMGKTAFMLNVARNTARKGTIPHIYSLEMQKAALLKRMIAAEGRIAGGKMRSHQFSEDDWERLIPATAAIAELPLKIFDKAHLYSEVAEIRAQSRKMIRDEPDRKHLIIIDYLQLLRGTGKSRVEEVSNITRDLKLMAIELNVPVIALSQLNRSVESRNDKRPTMADLRDSGSIEQDADMIWFLYRDEYYNPDTDAKRILETIIAKQREGETGVVQLGYVGQWSLVTDMPKDIKTIKDEQKQATVEGDLKSGIRTDEE